ncbi:MAG TPA: serpin family protein [Candidatus Dormibacteraeota bacterium]|jgi:serpin B|nr:serpin family protein [Candidatus Dormibacteraeota bacterium]
MRVALFMAGWAPAEQSKKPRDDPTRFDFLDVNEEGTKAAAITAVGFEVVVTSVPPLPTKFFVDRPFLFALRDEKTGTFLFVAYIAGPGQ